MLKKSIITTQAVPSMGVESTPQVTSLSLKIIDLTNYYLEYRFKILKQKLQKAVNCPFLGVESLC